MHYSTGPKGHNIKLSLILKLVLYKLYSAIHDTEYFRQNVFDLNGLEDDIKARILKHRKNKDKVVINVFILLRHFLHSI